MFPPAGWVGVVLIPATADNGGEAIVLQVPCSCWNTLSVTKFGFSRVQEQVDVTLHPEGRWVSSWNLGLGQVDADDACVGLFQYTTFTDSSNRPVPSRVQEMYVWRCYSDLP